MQKVKVLQVGSHSYTLKELPVREIWNLINNDDTTSEKSESPLLKIEKLLSLACPELNRDVLMELYPSEIEELWQAFEEVNAAFLGMVRKIGLDVALTAAIKEAVTSSIAQFASLSIPATVPESGIMATASFEQP